jgi:toxin ParE1/3/4
VKLRYTADSKDDIELAFVWYERQRRGLGFEFLDCVESSIQSILDSPKMYRIYYSNFHGCLVRRFPFSIFNTIEGKEIIVHSVFDNRRNPKDRP